MTGCKQAQKSYILKSVRKISHINLWHRKIRSHRPIAQVYLRPLQSSDNCILKEYTCKQRNLSSICGAIAQPYSSLIWSSKVKKANSMRKSVRNLAREVEKLASVSDYPGHQTTITTMITIISITTTAIIMLLLSSPPLPTL